MKRARIAFVFGFITVVLLLSLLFSSCGRKTETSFSFSKAKWTVIGPFDEPEQGLCTYYYQDLLADYGSESIISDTGLPDKVKKTSQIQAVDGMVDFGTKFPGKYHAVAYAFLEFEGDGEERIFTMGSDDGLRVWVNGKLMVDDHVHRSIDPNSNSFRVISRKGKNRILVKVCQGTGEWGFTLKETNRQEHESFLAESGPIMLSLSTDTRYIGDADHINFAIMANPAPLAEVPLTYSLADSEGKVITSGTAFAGEKIRAEIPPNNSSELYLTAVPQNVQDAFTRQKLENVSLKTILFRDDRESVILASSGKARKAAEELNCSPWTDLSAEDRKAVEDIGPTLLYLADLVDGKLHSSLVTDDKQTMAVSFINDIIFAMKEGPQALSTMTGYRQMAYISDIDGSIQPYCLYLPNGYSPDKTYSLIVAAHGYSVDDYNGGTHLAALMPEDFIIVSVFGRGDMYYQSVAEQDVLDVMDRIISRYPIDENRVYLTGISMGGLGTWRLGTLYADRFAAIAPYCGWTGTVFMENLLNTKVYVVHGDADTTVPVRFDRACVEVLKKLGCDVTYVEIPNGSHSAWGEWSKIQPPQTLLNFFRSAQRNLSPDRITATVSSVRYGKQYWVTVNELDTSGELVQPEFTVQTSYTSTYPVLPKPGRFEAVRSDDGSVQITTKRIHALTVDIKTAGLNGKPIDTIILDGTLIEVPSGAEVLHLAKNAEKKWTIDSRFNNATLPRHEGEGIEALFTKPLIIVYGTRNPESTPILKAAAQMLADWSIRPGIEIGVKSGIFKVKADTELTEEDLASHNLLLFGTAEENTISQRYFKAFTPYYQEGEILIDGVKYTGNGLCLTLPNPQLPGKMLGYMDITRFLQSTGSANQYFLNFQFRLRNSYINELMGTPTFCPDVFVMSQNPLRDAWSGWFDRYWENLQGTAAR